MDPKKEYVYMWSLAPFFPATYATAHALRDRGLLFDKKTSFQYYDGKIHTSFMLKHELEHEKQNIGRRYLDPSHYEQYTQDYLKEQGEWWDWIRTIEKKDYSTATKEELKADHQKYTDFMRDSIAYFGSTRPEYTYAAEEQLQSILKQKLGKDWPKAFEALVTPLDNDAVQIEQLSWLNLLSSDIEDKHLLDHASEYPWLVFGQFKEQEVIKYLKEAATHVTENYEDEKQNRLEKKEILKQTQKDILNQLDSKEANYLSKFLQDQSLRRMDIKTYWAGCHYLARNLLRSISQELNIPLSDMIQYIAPTEIQIMLSEKSITDVTNLLKKRKQAYAIIYTPEEEIKILEGVQATTVFEQTVSLDTGDSDSVKGQPASLGKIKGRVRKVIPSDLEMLHRDLKAFQEGEILVTPMTQPNMMVIAKKAAAIIADEGGITSHAAVISRELGIPCIVGCLNAMQTFNDGDLVEVDAHEGTAKIISRNK
ncbi:MAG: hypothetical protein KKG59_06430 [Nanoarchaeota archaeon]|nr:hypothetical protein [Nanoarchaeota archaeon]